jgi:hypothetical protein
MTPTHTPAPTPIPADTRPIDRLIEAFIGSGNPWLSGRELIVATGNDHNLYVHISRLAYMLETRPDPDNSRRNQYRFRPRYYIELCAARSLTPAPDGLKPYSLSEHMRNHCNGSGSGAIHDSSPFGDSRIRSLVSADAETSGAGDIPWEEG